MDVPTQLSKSQSWPGLLWPPASPWRGEDAVARRWWLVTCLMSVLPVAATLHNAIFYRGSCMLNPFGEDYTPYVAWKLLSQDPSVACAIVGMTIVYGLGRRWSIVRLVVAPLFLAFLPATIWILDIPFTGRIICHQWHDGGLAILGAPVRSRHVAMLCLLMYALLLGWTVQQSRSTKPPRADTL